MNPKYTQQEILLFTATSFFNRDFCPGSEPDKRQARQTPREQLTEACWNGMLAEILPELFPDPTMKQHHFLWNIEDGEQYIGLEMGEVHTPIDPADSLVPHKFLAHMNWN